ncbi:MAG: hypothetical protein IT235_07650, partial [Bacteroidia bacterium]|nr:hypothetical protein [Bacteroidia bacterium]
MKYTLLLLLFSISVNIQATVITGNANNYYTLVPLLTPGDTLMLHPGTYPWGLNIYDLTGTDSARIVIIGAPAYGSVFTGSPGVNTVSIKTSAYVSIYNIKIDGMQVSDDIDAVKAEGTSGNWAHHITLDGLWITGYDLDRNQVGISNKCPAWDWVIRNCTINTAGTGMYLGSSLGTEPFINGIIENCLIINTIGYNIEIKRQNDGLRTLPGMTLNGKTIIRNNVFSKGANSSGGDVSRPNLLLGGFPATGDGSNDRYEVYGNFFYQNPSEGLLQATGNHAIYNNIFYNNMGGWGIAIMSHEGHAPRLSDVFHNTVIVDGEDGIYYSGLDTNYASSQHCYANVSFSSTNPFVNIPVDNAENISGDYTDASTYLNNVTSNIP